MSITNESNWPVSECKMPDLSDLNSKKVLFHALMKLFCGGGSRDPIAASLAANFIRVTDHLIYEYENCRKNVLEFIKMGSGGHFSPYFRAVCQMESAVTNMHRAIRLAHRIRGYPYEPKIPIDKYVPVLQTAAEHDVRYFRDAVEHVYDQLTNGSDRTGVPASLVLRIDHFECEGATVAYKTFAAWIRQIDTIAQAVAEYKEPSA